jgi:hypothetical protein
LGAAVFPGAIVHGSGHFVLGSKQTASRLLIAEGIGLGMVLAGGTTIVLTGASRYLVGPAAAVTAVGFGVFTVSFLADVYGTLSVDGGAAVRRIRAPARVETELGHRYVYTPVFDYSHFVVERASIRQGRWRVTPSGWFATDGETGRYRLELARRLLGPVPLEATTSSSHAELVLGLVHHRQRPDGFSSSGVELGLEGRYDLAELGPTLRGSFAEVGVGYALQRIDYALRGTSVPADWEDFLLARFGFGVVLRGMTAPGSEVALYYDHRHDDFAAGLKVRGLGSGVAGHFGAAARVYADSTWGALLEAQAGSAYVLGASLLFREGVLP